MGLTKERRKFVGKGKVDARGGLYSHGVPVFGSPSMMVSGSVFHVSSTASNASDDNSGLTPDQPLATIDAAINKCTANKGDLIVVHENHAETILTDAAIDCDVAGISIVGLGQGNSRPVITMGATATGASTAATVEINALNVRLENLVFLTGIDALTKCIHVIGDDFNLVNCEFRHASGKQMLIAVNIGAANNDADRAKIYGNLFTSPDTGATSAISLTQLQDGVEIVGNTIYGDYSDAGIQNPTGEICTNLLIADNIISNLSTGNHAIQLVSACTGAAVRNMMYGDTLGTILDPGSLKCLGNMETDAIDQAGVASPVTAAGGLGIGAIGADTFQAGAIDAAAMAAGAIAADAFAADALQAMQDEAEDALEGENLDHLAATTTAAADMTAEVVDGSILSRILSKTSDTSTYDPTTDALEMASDKLGGFSGDGGAAQDDSAKASLDLVHTALGAADGATTESIQGKLGTDTELADRSMFDILVGDGPAVFPTAAAPGNDVSLAEVLRQVHDQTAGEWRFARSDWDFAADTGAAAAYPVFTVTGNVLLKIYAVAESSLTTGGGAVTVELGVSGNTAVFIPQIVDGRDLLANEIWHDATPTTTVEALDPTGKEFLVSNGQDVEFLIGAGGLTGGKVNFYAFWKPLSANGAVVAA